MNRLTELLDDRPAPGTYATRYLGYLRELLEQIDPAEVEAFIRILLDARTSGRRIFFIGNGGSASTASHFANDLLVGTRSWRRPFRVMSLTDNVAVLTAIGNDFGYDDVFTLQLAGLMESGDVVVAISASGNSPNIVSAVKWANEHGGVTVALTGFDGGQVRSLARQGVHIATAAGEYGPVEDVHLVINHLVATYLRGLCDQEAVEAP